MSDLLFSVRFGTVFWQLNNRYRPTVCRSTYYVNNRKASNLPWFKVDVLFGHHFE